MKHQTKTPNDVQDPFIEESKLSYKAPSERVNFLSYFHYLFIFNTVRTAKRLAAEGKSLDDKTLPGFPRKSRSEIIEQKFLDQLKIQMTGQSRKKPNLALAILNSTKWEIALNLILIFIAVACRILIVWIAKNLLDSLSDSDSPLSEGYKWSGALGGALLLALYAEHNFAFKMILLPISLKNGLISMVYTKITRLSVYSVNQISLGKLVNVVANDVNVFERTGPFFAYIFVGILSLIGSTTLLWTFFGPSCLVGIGYVLIGFPLQQLIAKASTKPRDKKNDVTDERIKRTNELIDGIRLLKMYAWELIFRDKISEVRKKEIQLLKKIAVLESTSRGIALSTQAVASFLIWMTYVLAGNQLKVSIVFPSIFLVSLVKNYSVFFFAMALNFIIEVRLVLKRIETIMEAPETENTKFEEPKDSNNIIELENFTAFWTKKDSNMSPLAQKKLLPTEQDNTKLMQQNIKPTLIDITLSIKKGSLNALVGKVGSGKSSFLLAFTGEMPQTEGSLRFKGNVAYVEQEPTIFSGTLRENILFGREYDPEFYDKVVKACNLESDILLFPNRDLSEIGEKGINLSGGQKARLSLARAIYSNADIYLLDDPLSAVDTKVAKSLYNDAISTLLKGKTVILVTHQVHFIKELENIILIDEGRVLGSGSYNQLKQQNIDVDKIFSSERRKSLIPIQPTANSKTFINSNNQIEMEKVAQDKEIKEENEEENEEENKESKVDEEKGKLFTSEDAFAGQVDMKTYGTFVSLMGWPLLVFVFFLFVSNELASVAFSRIAGAWAGDTLEKSTALGVMGGITGLIIIIYIVKNIVFNLVLLKSSRALHDRMLDRVIKNPVEFFDTNPVGRILNRFSNDLGVLDRFLPSTIMEVSEALFYIASSLITVAIINPILLIPIAITAVLAYLILNFCYQSIRQTRSYELSSRSPLYSLFSSSLAGIIVIRSYKQADKFIEKFRRHLYQNTKGNFAFWTTSRFFGFLVDITYHLAAIASIFIIAAVKNSNPSLSGLSISFLLGITGSLQYALRQMVQTNVLMASMGRVKAYCETPSEAALSQPQDNQLKQNNWPNQGEIKFSHVYMKYRQNTDYVIKDLSIDVKPGEKIGCIGRTGAGKSSIIQILFRMIEIDNSAIAKTENSYINIDNVNIKSLGLHMLRNNISIIPQTPFIFMGTVKRNLDPLGQFSDDELWKVLEDVDLKTYVENLDNQLYTDMTNASSVFSVGQKQLICLARAILKKSKLIVLDEATANVDLETDIFIQKKIMDKFSECTIFTIAHRLSTIANYDKVLVLEKGRKVEYDAPYKLLVKEIGDDYISNKEGYFASMVLNTGPKTSQEILRISKAKYFKSTHLSSLNSLSQQK